MPPTEQKGVTRAFDVLYGRVANVISLSATIRVVGIDIYHSHSKYKEFCCYLLFFRIWLALDKTRFLSEHLIGRY